MTFIIILHSFMLKKCYSSLPNTPFYYITFFYSVIHSIPLRIVNSSFYNSSILVSNSSLAKNSTAIFILLSLYTTFLPSSSLTPTCSISISVFSSKMSYHSI